jgi:hypothetical protein
MIRNKNLTLSGTAQEVTIADAIDTPNTISIQNTHASLNAYIGTAAVTTSSYGVRLKSGEAVSFDLGSSDKLYAVGDSGTTLAILIIEA